MISCNWFCSHRRIVQYKTAYYSFYLPVINLFLLLHILFSCDPHLDYQYHMNMLLICCFIKGCMCPAALWREFGQVWWCREHPCWNGNILSSPGNTYFAVCIYVHYFLSQALVCLVLIWLFSIRMTIWIVMVILNLLARLVHLSISVNWTSILIILIFFLLLLWFDWC